jgi:hypothetical protein
MEWNDLGNSYRVLATFVEKNGELADLARLWPAAEGTPFSLIGRICWRCFVSGRAEPMPHNLESKPDKLESNA